MWLKGAFPFGEKGEKKNIKAIPQLVQIFKLKNLYDKNLFFSTVNSLQQHKANKSLNRREQTLQIATRKV